ncbi:helix-turn-helix domain-containing protein [Schleiferilactobacillus shenzhenensis]|uniref:HTH cro/C1-type domain-containing protein n=1 Tax=Schleiferilactobacillus shenzhenensis LY-73 TaxID=1231336 RepID=U4TRT4_9LACO|nr:helix-turn-helix transcriptional regulator [Schleiferilactobacillus shenzhenensis]ERL64613.1 hypothetical protein L248_0797 [Schleiferilactobacillus shenzhenensis LY-73]
MDITNESTLGGVLNLYQQRRQLPLATVYQQLQVSRATYQRLKHNQTEFSAGSFHRAISMLRVGYPELAPTIREQYMPIMETANAVLHGLPAGKTAQHGSGQPHSQEADLLQDYLATKNSAYAQLSHFVRIGEARKRSDVAGARAGFGYLCTELLTYDQWSLFEVALILPYVEYLSATDWVTLLPRLPDYLCSDVSLLSPRYIAYTEVMMGALEAAATAHDYPAVMTILRWSDAQPDTQATFLPALFHRFSLVFDTLVCQEAEAGTAAFNHFLTVLKHFWQLPGDEVWIQFFRRLWYAISESWPAVSNAPLPRPLPPRQALTIPDYLETMRRAKKMTIADVTRQADISFSTYHRIVQDNQGVKVDAVFRLLDALRIDPLDITLQPGWYEYVYGAAIQLTEILGQAFRDNLDVTSALDKFQLQMTTAYQRTQNEGYAQLNAVAGMYRARLSGQVSSAIQTANVAGYLGQLESLSEFDAVLVRFVLPFLPFSDACQLADKAVANRSQVALPASIAGVAVLGLGLLVSAVRTGKAADMITVKEWLAEQLVRRDDFVGRVVYRWATILSSDDQPNVQIEQLYADLLYVAPRERNVLAGIMRRLCAEEQQKPCEEA